MNGRLIFGRRDKVNLSAALVEQIQYWYWGVHYGIKWALKKHGWLR